MLVALVQKYDWKGPLGSQGQFWTTGGNQVFGKKMPVFYSEFPNTAQVWNVFIHNSGYGVLHPLRD